MSLLEEELKAEADESQGAAATSPAALTAFRRGASGVIVPRISARWSSTGVSSPVP